MDGRVHFDAASAVGEDERGQAQSSSSTEAAAVAASGGGSAAAIAAAARRNEAGGRGGAASHKGVPQNMLKMIETATFSKILSLNTQQDDRVDDCNLAGAVSETRGMRADGQGDRDGIEGRDEDDEEIMCEICQSAYNKRDEVHSISRLAPSSPASYSSSASRRLEHGRRDCPFLFSMVSCHIKPLNPDARAMCPAMLLFLSSTPTILPCAP
jgi:hypothetical protein